MKLTSTIKDVVSAVNDDASAISDGDEVSTDICIVGGRSVVDPNCTVHGYSNLHAAGSAVFPTASWANPTLTIIALALRQAEYLAARG